VRDEVELSPATALRRLPPAALAGLREAFAAEVAERLPRLQDAVERDDPALLPVAVRDAHALGSSSAVLGEPEASRSARAAEAVLLERPADDALSAARPHVTDLARHLAGWRP
jgi:HPt (histidine-containing phosphotransfer) domain-containing protein